MPVFIYFGYMFIHADIKEEFIKEVLQFAKQMFTSSFTDSLDQKGSASSKSNFASADKVNINFGELSVANTSVSVQLVLWATADESGLCSLIP